MTLENFKIALLTFVMCLHITNVFSQEALVPEFELYHAFPQQLNNYRGPVVELESGDFIVTFGSSDGCYEGNMVGLHKISYSGEVIADINFNRPENYQFPKSPVVVSAAHHGLFALGTYEPLRNVSDSDEAAVFFHKVDENLNIVFSREYEIIIDTVPDLGININPRASLFSAFDAEDGIWACIYKQVAIDTSSHNNDSILFWKFDYEGNKIAAKYMELTGYGNDDAFVGNCVRETETGYDLFLIGLNMPSPYSGNKQLVIQSYDRDFNFLGEVERAHNNPDYYLDVSVKALSSENTIVASWVASATNGMGVALTNFDKTLRKVKEHVYQGFDDWDEFSATWSGVDFIDENRIFWAYTDHYDMEGNHDYDSWLGINLLTADLEIEHTYFYDMYGEKSWMQLSATKATRDGGLLLTGQINGSINVYPRKEDCFAVKFPAEAFLGIEEAHKYGLKTAVAYPNPGQNELNIKTGLENARIEVYNVQGGRAFESEAADKVTTIDASGWSSGIYLWKVIVDGKEVESGKWVK